MVVWHRWLAEDVLLSGFACILPGFNPCLHSFYSLTRSWFCSILPLDFIGAGYIGHCVVGSFYFVTFQKKGKRRKIWLNAFSCKQWGRRSLKKSLKNHQPCFVLRHFISPGFYCNTYQHLTSHNVQQMVVFYAAKCNKRTLPPTSCKWCTCQTCRRPSDSIQARCMWINKMLKAFVLVKLFQYLPHFKLVFSYQTKPAHVSTILNKQPPDKVHFAAILNLIPICQSCQRTPGLSSLTLGFKILGYLDEVYSTCLGSNVEHVLRAKADRFGSFC